MIHKIIYEMGASYESSKRILKRRTYKCYKVRRSAPSLQARLDKTSAICSLDFQKKKVPNVFSNILWSDESKFTNSGSFSGNMYIL